MMKKNAQSKVRIAVFPVGGFGTRFLPATKSMPKEMLPVAAKPLVQYAFEEAQDAGIEKFIFITGRNKNTINNHFDHSYELQSLLSKRDKRDELSLTKDWLPDAGTVAFIRQQEALGLGHAVHCARDFIGDEPFAVLLADEMLKTPNGFLKQMIKLYEKTGGNIIAVAPVERQNTSSYGIIDFVEKEKGKYFQITDMVEKPKPDDAPSLLSITGRYILQPEIFSILERQEKGASNEIQLTDAMRKLLKKQKFYALPFYGPRFDCGNRLGFLEANIAYEFDVTKDPEAIKEMMRKYCE